MNRICTFLCLLALLLQLTACIHPELLDPDTGGDETDPAVAPPTDDPSTLLFPWQSAAQAAADTLADTKHAVVDVTKAEYTYEEMKSDLEALQARYPHYFSYRAFGRSADGKELYVGVLGDPNAPRRILVSAGIHGREYLTPLLVMKQLEFYLRYYETGSCNGVSYSTIFRDCCFYVVPMTNPDGIMLAIEGLDSLQSPALRETVQQIYAADYAKEYTYKKTVDEYLRSWKANANGVDLNRNFDALWENYRMGEPVPCHKNYKGPSAASEPETQAMTALTESIPNPDAVLCIHSRGEILYWNCGQPSPLYETTRDFTATVSSRTGYTFDPEQNNDASFSDWCALEKGLVAITVETGSGNLPLPISQFEKIWYDNFDLWVLSALYFQK